MNEYFFVAVVFLLIALYYLYRKNHYLESEIKSLKSKKQSLSTRYGQIFEQLIPFSKDFPFDPKQFRFLGSPIDGVVFEDDKIVFVEIKLNNSKKSQKQNNIKKIIEQNKVYFSEVRG
ncbi:MAG: endonuclease [Candidatus Aenigmarchaeota archaeon]|nr:endonuclease [Candidatus Aenigmarchaeota archaeon]